LRELRDVRDSRGIKRGVGVYGKLRGKIHREGKK
jgi:hypothetical protein